MERSSFPSKIGNTMFLQDTLDNTYSKTELCSNTINCI